MNIVRSLLLIVKLVVEALDIARAHILSVQLLDLKKKEFMSRMGEEFIFEDKTEKSLPLAWRRERFRRRHWRNHPVFRLFPC